MSTGGSIITIHSTDSIPANLSQISPCVPYLAMGLRLSVLPAPSSSCRDEFHVFR